MTPDRPCDCGCGASLVEMRSDARFASEACKKRFQRADSRDKAGTDHPLDEVRALHEESKGRWTVVVREHLNRTLLDTGHVSAEDFDKLGIPAEHSNLANAQMGSYVARKLMEPVSWKRSTKPSRKSGKFWIYRITDLGREKLARHRAEGRSQASTRTAPADATPSPVSGENGSGVENPEGTTPAATGAPRQAGGSSYVSSPSNSAGSSLDATSPDPGSGDLPADPSGSPESPARPSEPDHLFGSSAYQHLQDVA